jgi:hypothetical protein
VTEVPKNDLIAGGRKVRISCEAKVVGASHTLRFVIKEGENDKTYYTLAEESSPVTEDVWTPIQCYVVFSAAFDFWLKIEDRDVSEAPSSVQIRNLVVAELTE